VEKKGYRMQMQITLEILFLVYLLFRMAIPSSTCQIPFPHNMHILMERIKPRPDFSLIVRIFTWPITLTHVAHALQQQSCFTKHILSWISRISYMMIMSD